jgi:hypothetical protein
MTTREISLHAAEAACTVSIVAWIFALLTWRRALAQRAFIFLVANVALLIVLGARPVALTTAFIFVVPIVVLELTQNGVPWRPKQ